MAVLREALTRDEVARKKSLGVRVRKGEVGETVKAFIQNVHNLPAMGQRQRGPVVQVGRIYSGLPTEPIAMALS